MMERTDNRLLQEAPDAFDGVGVDIPPDKFILGMVNSLMAGVMVSNASVSRPVVGENGYGIGSDVPQGDFMESLSGTISSDLKNYFPTTLDYPYHKSLVAFVAPALPCPSLPFCHLQRFHPF
jgi:hypothetical protein